MKIVSRYNSTRVLWEGEAVLMREAVERAAASGANLAGANLRAAYLRGAHLRDANLSGANLRDANLAGANLLGAYLADANLAGANLLGAYGIDCAHQSSIVRPPVGDPRGYDCIAQWDGEQWIVMAGCRRFTAAEAAEHWGDGYEGDRATGDRYLFGIGCLTGVNPPRAEARQEP